MAKRGPVSNFHSIYMYVYTTNLIRQEKFLHNGISMTSQLLETGPTCFKTRAFRTFKVQMTPFKVQISPFKVRILAFKV